MDKRKPVPRKTPESKVDTFVEKVSQGKSGVDSVIESGWNQSRKAARVTASRLLSNPIIAERVERRKEAAMRAASIHTDVIVGSLAEIATASLADVVPDDPLLKRAKEMGSDHLIKKVKVHTRKIPQKGHDSEGNPLPDITETTHEFEMYSRLDALNQLRDTFGLKEAERPNKKNEAESLIADLLELAVKLNINLSEEDALVVAKLLEPEMVSELTQ